MATRCNLKTSKSPIMLFNSYTFILFLAVVLLLHYSPLSWRFKKINLLTASYLFYALWNPPFILLLWLSTIADYLIGKKLFITWSKSKRKWLLFLSLAINLGMLGFFKYGGFLLENFVSLASLVGIDFHPAKPSIILPVGISFYTFQTLSYTLDMYKRRGRPETSLLDFSLFVTFFPQLVAGPIVRPSQLLPQFKKPHTANTAQFIKGMMLLSLGLCMKVVMADTMLSGAADTVFTAPQKLMALDAWLGVFAFSGQIFFDFAGYSTCAIGVAAMLGFSLPDNFRYPYAAIGFSDFWRRWHVTLSTWLRDYVYIPLGGNRRGEVSTYINLMITMLLGGLWHGASWTFVAWGALHGLYLAIEKVINKVSKKKNITPVEEMQPLMVERASIAPAFFSSNVVRNIALALVTYLLVNITWVFFRAADFTSAWRLLQSMFGSDAGGVPVLTTIDMIKVSIVTIGMVSFHWIMRNTTVWQTANRIKWWITAILWSITIIAIIMSQKSSDSFIYFQF